ncbi:unnamed protein product [Macrosiphum euphorbiae]|uniref:Uncharacterized protein n=1 Tax=Macrosiphum euphorbiae TaxID=13131 RepID=A0AAV0XDJ9_9HEMI|nr:unnamed protein product [Macrosiphum euphorbiae]
MLSLFRQMEVARPAVPEGLKPLKRFTPPLPDLKESETESESDDDVSGEDDSDEESSSSETNGDVVKSSLKVEDEFLKNSQSAVMAKSLKDKFEHWEPDKHSMNNAVTMLDSGQESIESTKSLRARFESLKGDRPADKPLRLTANNLDLMFCISCLCSSFISSRDLVVINTKRNGKTDTCNRLFNSPPSPPTRQLISVLLY